MARLQACAFLWVCGLFVYCSDCYLLLNLDNGYVCDKNNKSLSVCKPAASCTKARDDFLNKSLIPTICNIYDESDPSVCCEEELYVYNERLQTEDDSIATKMCVEYASKANTIGAFCPVPGGVELADRIINGEDAETREFPHMALIGFGSNKSTVRWACGGSLISERFVLSAAHCAHTYTRLGRARYVRLGDYDISSNEDEIVDSSGYAKAKVRTYEIVQRFTHPDYDKDSVYFDIMLTMLDKDVEFDAYVRPLCLQTRGLNPDLLVATATGWGKTRYRGMPSEVLQKAALRLISVEECNKVYYGSNKQLQYGVKQDIQLCAGGFPDGKDTCQGDSGGPLVIGASTAPCMYTLIGITSYGKKCGEYPGVYTSIPYFLPWIESIVWNDTLVDGIKEIIRANG